MSVERSSTVEEVNAYISKIKAYCAGRLIRSSLAGLRTSERDMGDRRKRFCLQRRRHSLASSKTTGLIGLAWKQIEGRLISLM